MTVLENVFTKKVFYWLMLCSFLWPLQPGLWAQGSLLVSVAPSEPCAFYKSGKPVSGFSIDLLNTVAAQEKIQVKYLSPQSDSSTIKESLAAIEDKPGLVVGCIRETSAGEGLYDFIHVLETGYRALVKRQESFFKLYDGIVKTLAIYGCLLLVSGLLMVLAERKHKNANIKNVYDGLYLAHTVATTVGFGDLFPVTKQGRALFFIMSITGLIIFGNVVSELSLIKIKSHTRHNIENISDLQKLSVGVLEDSGAYYYLRDFGTKARFFKTTPGMYKALMNEKIDVAFGSELPILHIASQNSKDVTASRKIFNPHNYGWIVSPVLNSAMVDKIKVGILKARENGAFEKIYHRWFGPD